MADMIPQYAELRRSARGVFIAGGEHEYTRWGIKALLDAQAVHVLQPDLTWAGGLTELTKICALASANGIPVIPHHGGWPSTHLIASQTLTTCPMQEWLFQIGRLSNVFYKLVCACKDVASRISVEVRALPMTVELHRIATLCGEQSMIIDRVRSMHVSAEWDYHEALAEDGISIIEEDTPCLNGGIRPTVEVPESLRAAVGGHPLISEHLTRKGIGTPTQAQRFLSAAHYRQASANDLPDIDRAVDRVARALRTNERILIWGDFDVDGQTSTALLYSALGQRGARVSYHVPNRFSEGHGIHLPTLKTKLDAGVDLILTCDTGVGAHDAVDYAASRGVDTVITDHHALPESLPAAVAVLNPRRLPAGHPLSELPGVGVAWKLIEALFDGEHCDFLLDLVALGIVADVMLQVDDTRYLLQRGLEALRENRRLGLRALLERAQIEAGDLNEGHIGFDLAPRLNALGRLDDANPAVELLTTADWGRARQLADALEGLNARRRFLSDQVFRSTLSQIEGDPSLLEYAALVMSHDDWHSGVIGIVASRLAEAYHRPVVLIATPDDVGRGSARSVAGVDITVAFGQVAQFLTRFGGHSMAAGASMPAEKIFEFRRALSAVVRDMIGDRPVQPRLSIDGYLDWSEISLELTGDIERLAPFGNGNPPLTLVSRDLKVVSRTGLDRRGEHLQLQVEDEGGQRQRVIWWRGAGQDIPSGAFDLAYTLRTSTYKGEREASVEWLDHRQRGTRSADFDVIAPAFELIDYRQSMTAEDDLAVARAQFPDALVWAEVAKVDGAVDRLHLGAAETLIVWTSPPSSDIWSAALTTVDPARLIVFSAGPQIDSRSAFLLRLAGLAKFALANKTGKARLEELAAAMGDRERSVVVGLQLLRALGKLDFQVGRTGEYLMAHADDAPGGNVEILQKRLDLLLRETRAYRSYWTATRIKG